MSEINLIVLENYKAGADVEGKTYVGGNVTGQASLGIGNSANHQTAVDSYHSTLAVGGNNSAQLNVKHGSGSGDSYGAYIVGSSGQLDISEAGAVVRIGGSASNINLHAGSRIEIGGSLTNINLGAGTSGSPTINKVGGSVTNVNGANNTALYVGGSISGNANANGASFHSNYGFSNATVTAPVVTSLSGYTAQLTADVKALSVALGALTIANNPSTITYGSQGPTLHAVASSAGFAVFNVNENFFSYGEVKYDFANTSMPVIINISSSNMSLHNAVAATYNWNLNPVSGANSTHNQQIIWNFTDASTVNLNRAVFGSILAPTATVTNNGPVNGSVVAKIFNQSGEVHLGTYARDIEFISADDSVVPEPAIWLQLITGFGLTGALMRRRQRTIA
ncbi:collagen-binding domain-containing protein [Glacieibacterium sp.]|uniref:collagen-binding domain-containing protein n=1 Tax=Glacieibacterium sp. TaxID=2860237 RepID=UPI003AFFDB6A